MGRVACLLVPSFPLAARLRADPPLARLPLAVVEGSGSSSRICAATAAARRSGVQRGLSLPQARALLPQVELKPRDPHAEAAAQQALLEAAEAFSPIVEDAGPGVVYLDLDGCPDEKASLRSLARRCAGLGLPARAGVAGCRVAARLAARLSADGDPTVVRPGGDRDFLAPLPLAHLSPAAKLSGTLERWGLRTIGALAALPESQLAARLGHEGWLLRRLARGEDPKPLIPRRPPARYQEGFSADWALTELEPFMAAAEGLISRLTARLDGRGLACRALSLSLRLEPSGVDERLIRLPAPTREPKTLLGLIRLELAARPPASPVCGLEVRAEPDAARGAQLSLFGRAAPSPDVLSAMLARLAALLGPANVGSPASVDGHRPERFGRVDFVPAEAGEPALDRPEPRCAVRVLRPALPLEVLCAGERPRRLRACGERPRLALDARVVVASGPWRVEEGWWGESAILRDYWDVELDDGGLYRIYLDRLKREWFADGLYD